MTEDRVSSTAVTEGGVARAEGARSSGPTSVPPPPAGNTSAWTAGRAIALAIGVLLVVVSLSFFGAGGAAVWAVTLRDHGGFVTTDVHTFSTDGSALVTDPVELGSPGVEWLYSGVVLGTVRIRATATSPDTRIFVGIGRSSDVARYLAGVDQTTISDFWTGQQEQVTGNAPPSPPSDQHFWAASKSGVGTQTLSWEPANGSWTVVVMNADASPQVSVAADVGAELPSLAAIAVVSIALGVLIMICALLLIVGAGRRVRSANANA